MKKGIIIGIAIAVVIGIGVIAASQNSENNTEISIDEEINDEPKKFVVGLEDGVGFSDGP